MPSSLWNITMCKSYVYWTVHHCDSWRIRDQLYVTSYNVLFHFFYAQHVSDINTSIIRSLRLFYCITTLVVCSCFDVAGLWWYPCSRLKPATRIPDLVPLLFHFQSLLSDLPSTVTGTRLLRWQAVYPYFYYTGQALLYFPISFFKDSINFAFMCFIPSFSLSLFSFDYYCCCCCC